MLLEQFITYALVGIATAVAKAQTQMPEGALVNPAAVSPREGEQGTQIYAKGRCDIIQNVQFDVAVTATEQKKSKGGGAIAVLGITLGASRGKNTADTQVSRLQFSVPLLLPAQSLPAGMQHE